MEQHVELHPIACESCRTKKSKCDRELPICSQCTTNGTTCRYAPSHKRGIPSGYVASIEQRLLETEVALFEVLSTIYQGDASQDTPRASGEDSKAMTDFLSKQSKLAKIDEWKRLPLHSADVRRQWWQNKQEVVLRQASDHDANHVNSASESHPVPSLDYYVNATDTVRSAASLQPSVGVIPVSFQEPPSLEPPSSPGLVSTDGSSRQHAPTSASTREWRKYF